MLTDAQRARLLEGIRGQRVKQVRGFSHLETYEVIAHLTRMFGFEGWDKEITELTPIFEDQNASKWTVAYRCTMRLTVRDPEGNVVTVKEDASTGDAKNQPSRADAHDLAIKSAVSGALKRCAKDLGDQMGLSLYNDGSFAPVVQKVWPYSKEETDGGQQLPL